MNNELFRTDQNVLMREQRFVPNPLCRGVLDFVKVYELLEWLNLISNIVLLHQVDHHHILIPGIRKQLAMIKIYLDLVKKPLLNYIFRITISGKDQATLKREFKLLGSFIILLYLL